MRTPVSVQTANGSWLLGRLSMTQSLRCLAAPFAGLEGRRAASPRRVSYRLVTESPASQRHINYPLVTEYRARAACVCTKTHQVHIRHRLRAASQRHISYPVVTDYRARAACVCTTTHQVHIRHRPKKVTHGIVATNHLPCAHGATSHSHATHLLLLSESALRARSANRYKHTL